VLTEEWESFTPGLHMEVLEDKSNQLTIEEILAGKRKEDFVKSESKYPFFGLSKYIYWGRFTIQNPLDIPQDWFLEAWQLVQYADLYIVENGVVTYKRTEGRIFPYSHREVKFHNTTFKVQIKPQSQYVVYIKIKSWIPTFSLTLWSHNAFNEMVQGEIAINGILYGIMLLMIFYNLFIFITLRDSRYLYYVLLIFSGLLSTLSFNQIGFQLFWSDSPEWEVYWTSILLLAPPGVFAILFTQQFLQTKEKIPTIHSLLNVLAIYFIFGMFVTYLDAIWGVKSLTLGALLFILLFTIAGIKRYRDGFRPAGYFLVAWTMFFVSILIRSLGVQDIIPLYPFLFIYGRLIGFAIDAVILSMALTDRINILKEEKEKADFEKLEAQKIHAEELENKVEERTKELTKTKDALARTLSEEKTIMNANPDILYVFDMEGKLIKWNKGLEDFTGLSPHELLHRPAVNFVNEKEKEMVMLKIQEVFEKGESNLEVNLISKDNNLVPYLCNGVILKNEKGELSGFTGTGRNISEIKKVEEQLRNAKIQADEANKSKSEFLSIMSHELRTPLNPIIGLSHLTLKTKLTKKQREYVEKMQMASQSMLNIINEILDLSKIEAGKLDMEEIEFDPHVSTKKIAYLFQDKVQEKGLDFKISLSNEVPSLLIGDPLRLEQIISNLVSNAIKFTEKGGIFIEVEKESETENSITLRFSIKDTGIGISEEQQLKLFKNFSQADSSTTRKYGGTGLGLSICQKLVKMMKGAIYIKSGVDVGSVFTFTATFGYKTDSKVDLAEQNSQKNLAQITFSEKHHILVVDDNPINQMVARDLLEDLALKVTTAESGTKAISVIKETKFDLIFMDIQMPEMDGYEATQKIKALEEFNNIPIIAMTAHASDDAKEKTLLAGMNDHISKPVVPISLQKILIKWLKEGNELKKTETVKTENKTQQLPEELPGIDLKSFKENMGDNEEFCIELLNTFYDLNREAVRDIKEKLLSDDLDETMKLAHKLAGSAGTFCAISLYDIAKKIESKAAKKETGIEELMPLLEKEFQTVWTSIESLHSS
ncbi:MAG: response regulator, partial [Nitrospinae bacterium]|nr:response regulator [Nitrospinota bacterium]